jgi:Nuclease-related domain
MDHRTDDYATTARPELRRLSLRYAGTCVACGAQLAKGADALYDPAAKEVRCMECATLLADADEAQVDNQEPAIDAGRAGASARREYERRRDNREAHVKDRFGKRVGGVILALTDEPQSTRAWARGAIGEEELAEALSTVEGVRVLHDRRVRGTRGNIDHLVVAPAGVFVIDAKRYRGPIRVRDVGGFFKRDERLYVGSRDCSKLAEGLGWQVEAVERALRAVPIDPVPPITPVLCFVDGEWPLLTPPHSFAGVRLEGTRSIRKLIMANRVFDEAMVDLLARVLAGAFPPK